MDMAASCVGRIRKAGALYSRFRPQLREPPLQPQKHPAGDIPGSRTWRAPSSAADYVNTLDPLPGDQVVSKNVTVDAHDLFSQLTTLVYLGKRETSRGLLFSIQEVSEGTIRVWREWLSKRCESKKWTDGEKVAVHRDPPVNPTSSRGKSRSDSVTGYEDPTKDPSILWINTRDDNVGVKFRVKERNMRRANPILFSDDTEVAVSYEVEFEEVLVRTTHLLLKLEGAQQQIDNHNGKAIVFGSYAGLQEFDTAGHPRR
ncbi:hypothetical protein LTR78_001593 [Recurvomyces mirabilis]|uniref:Uncharacterized protein n=1 Tax=Recurvomyces mirabilis TaxID=574656 RepID=A0AAE0WUX9_9PEZI|nr:hypothetical protein LTR78_001593 [Recurvomyces mirabilis]KAK5151835.1 hypothetical protein LTS14_008969 [Recurvomyces mirabilis]